MDARTARGIALLELLVVLMVLGLLVGWAGPQVMKHLSESKGKLARLQLQELIVALDIYRLEVGRYPTSEEGLNALVERPAGIEFWNGPYLHGRAVPTDPWGRTYHYRSPGLHAQFDLYSLGADNAEGGEGEQRDVANWQ